MKLISWMLVFLFAGLAFYLFSGIQHRELELISLRSQTADMQHIRAELEQAKASQTDVNELERLRKENDEIYKLRGEVARLQKENQQLTNRLQAQAANERQLVQIDDPTTQPPVEEDPQTKLQREQASQCVKNMQAIEEAKTMWAVANNKQAGENVTLQDITTSLPNGVMPFCPSGGNYNLNQVGVPVSCTIPSHSLLP